MALLPNYQANTDVGSGLGGPILNRLMNPGVLEDVSRGGFGGNLLQPQIIADLNRRVASGELTQDQANAQWAQMREAEAEAARGRATSALQFQQHGLATIGSMGLGGLVAGGMGGNTDVPAEQGTSGTSSSGGYPNLGQIGGLANQVLGGGGGSGGAATGGSNTGGIVGSLLGGALGGLGGGNRPAGTTTTTTNQTLAPGGMQQLQNTIAGQYLDPATNPYLNQTYDAAARQITPRVNSLFEASGRYGSGAHQGVLGQTLSDLGTSIYGGNYNAERSRQLAAAGTPVGNTVQNPYFTNPLGGALSGALAGGVLGGGSNFLNGGILNGLGGLFNNSSGNTGGTSDQTNNWNPSMPLPDYYGSSTMGSSPANFAYNPNSYAGNNYYGLNSGAPSPTSIDDSSRMRVPL